METSSKGLEIGEKLVGRDANVEGVAVLQLADPRILNDSKDELLGHGVCRSKYLEVGNVCLVFCLHFDVGVGFSVLCYCFVVYSRFCWVYESRSIFCCVPRRWHDETHEVVGSIFLVVGDGEEGFFLGSPAVA